HDRLARARGHRRVGRRGARPGAPRRRVADLTAIASGLAPHGIEATADVHWNLATPALYEHAIRRGEGVLAEGGPLVVATGPHTGRSPDDKFVVREPGSEGRIWWGKANRPLDPEHYDGLREKVASYLAERELFVVDAFAGADPAHRIALRVVTPVATHALFARTIFIEPAAGELGRFAPEAAVLHAPAFGAHPAAGGPRP